MRRTVTEVPAYSGARKEKASPGTASTTECSCLSASTTARARVAWPSPFTRCAHEDRRHSSNDRSAYGTGRSSVARSRTPPRLNVAKAVHARHKGGGAVEDPDLPRSLRRSRVGPFAMSPR